MAAAQPTAARRHRNTADIEIYYEDHGADQGHLLRLWALPDERALGLYRARDAAQMEAILTSLPLAPWMTMDTTPLSPHPSDPAISHPPTTAAAGTP